MHKDDILELAFSNYIDKRKYDESELQADVIVFTIARRAFIAGWKAAKNPPKMPKTSETSQELAAPRR